jgi:endonuclease-8
MPEGDTIHRAADRLRPVLAGARVVSFRAPRLGGGGPAPGTEVEDVEARGKHLLVHFGGGLSLRTHMRMTGSWHLYRTGERWQKPAHLARVVLEVDSGWTAVCFTAPVVELYRRPRRHDDEPAALAHLGPDLCRADADLDEAVRRLASRPEAEIGDALLDQRIAAGIGNVYKSETLFACRVDPWVRVGALDDDTRQDLVATAARLLRANLGGGPRITTTAGTTGGDRLAVYRRRGRPCPRCGTAIQMRRQGEAARSTYWCPGCQSIGRA